MSEDAESLLQKTLINHEVTVKSSKLPPWP